MTKRLRIFAGIGILSVLVLGGAATANAKSVRNFHVAVLDHRIDIDSLHVSLVDAQVDARLVISKAVDLKASVDVDHQVATTRELARKISAHRANTLEVTSRTHHRFLNKIDPPLSHNHVVGDSGYNHYSHLNFAVDASNPSDINRPSPLSRQHTASADLPDPTVTTRVSQFR
jgi:hypothetical protein